MYLCVCVPNAQIQPDQSVQCHWHVRDFRAEHLALEIELGALPWERLFLLLSDSFGGGCLSYGFWFLFVCFGFLKSVSYLVIFASFLNFYYYL